MRCIVNDGTGWSGDHVDIAALKDGANFIINFSLSGAKGFTGELYPSATYKESNFNKIINRIKRTV